MPFKTNKTAEEKLAIVLEGLKGETTVSDLCRNPLANGRIISDTLLQMEG